MGIRAQGPSAAPVTRCKTCGEYIYKGKKFNARKETVQNEVYLGLPIFRFYIKCIRCLAEITFKVRARQSWGADRALRDMFKAASLMQAESCQPWRLRQEGPFANPHLKIKHKKDYGVAQSEGPGFHSSGAKNKQKCPGLGFLQGAGGPKKITG